MKNQRSVIGLVVLVLAFGAASVAAMPPLPTNRLVLPHAVSNTVAHETDWPVTEVSSIVNVCEKQVQVTWMLRHRDGSLLATGQQELNSWAVWSFNVRDALLGAGLPVSMEEEEVYLHVSSGTNRCLIGDSFRLDTAAASGAQFFSPSGDCGWCDRRAIRYVNGFGFTGDLVLQWTYYAFGKDDFTVVARDDSGHEIATFVLSELPQSVSIPFDELGLPEDFHLGTLEVICPDGSCYVGTEYYSHETDKHGRAIRRERVPGWAVCLPGRPPVVVPECEGIAISSSGDTVGVIGEDFSLSFTVTGSKPITIVEQILPEGLTLSQNGDLFQIAGKATEEGECLVRFKNACSEATVQCAIICEQPPECEENVVVAVSDGSTEGTVGEPFALLLKVVAGTPPFDITASLPDGLFTAIVDEDTFGIFGVPVSPGSGTAEVFNSCSSWPVEILINEPEPPDECEEAPPLQLIVAAGDDDGTVGESFQMCVDVLGDLSPFTYTPILLDGLSFGEDQDGRGFCVFGIPNEDGEGVVKVRGQCDTASITYTIRPPEEPPLEGQGCTPGYWRQEHHYDSWVGYSPTDDFDAVFGRDAFTPDIELGEAVFLGGGDLNALSRHAVAALLNAASPFVDYPYSEAEVISMFQTAFDSGVFEETKDLFDLANNLGCPLN